MVLFGGLNFYLIVNTTQSNNISSNLIKFKTYLFLKINRDFIIFFDYDGLRI